VIGLTLVNGEKAEAPALPSCCVKDCRGGEARRKTRFPAWSHELRIPLNSILLWCNALILPERSKAKSIKASMQSA